ncbi:hypothetical protein NYE54_05345 [Paenibacillus sp. FSL K6-1330]|uniref:DUF3885 domain-containing protein n=1 Tax=Paenibacillus sp. FSL K6-1330 TaxID=2975292 RepID=UPI0030DBE5A7
MNIVKKMKAHGPHIRFELGLDNLMVEAYRRKSLRRALAIYRSIFGSEDDVIFIHRTSHCKSDPLMISSNGFLFFVKTIMEEIKKRKGMLRQRVQVLVLRHQPSLSGAVFFCIDICTKYGFLM